MANRMKKFLPAIIEKNQSAFIRGRSITDNILMAQELVRGYGKTTLSPRCAIKIDLQKAFDSLSWKFIFDVLIALKFPRIFVEWIRKCITTPWYSISINGGLEGYFKGGKGIRQGDPLFPYIFVIVMNVLSSLLDAAAAQGVFKFHPKCKRINLTHLSFADDLLIFTKGELESVVGIQKVLELFYTYSGLKLNCEKNELFSIGVQRQEIERIHQATGFKISKLPVRYLGVPLVTKRLTARDCEPLMEKITARINAWSVKMLSYAGRLQLIKSVLFSMHNYWCRQFILSKGVLKRICQLCAGYLWQGKESTVKGARVSWKTICYPKSEGGLGIKDLDSWNKACIIQNIWAIITQSGSLWIA